MPSAFTHMFLAKNFNTKSNHGNEDLEFLLDDKLKYFQLGALAPDLAYSQIPRIHNSEQKIADMLHYNDTNQVTLKALESCKHMPDGEDKDDIFTFALGNTSHIVADGIIHPFVRDKVGDYEDNATAHRTLEMRLDVIFLYELTKCSGHGANLNYTDLQDQVKDPLHTGFRHISSLYAGLINEVYKDLLEEKAIDQIDAKTYEDWVDDTHDLFKIAEGSLNQYYAWIPGIKDYLFKNLDSVLRNKDTDLLLKNTQAKGRSHSFLNRDVHFLDDCVPLFFEVYKNVALAAYDYVYNNGAEFGEHILPAINLDDGRPIKLPKETRLDVTPTYWRGV